MPSKKNNQSTGVRRALRGDDFQIINNINSIVESRLYQSGILTFEELAALTPEQIFKKVGCLTGFTLKQVIEQDWVGQAQKLSEKHDLMNGSKESEGFILNLFLNKQKLVHSTQILHVNSDEGEKWNGWDSNRLQNFIISHSGVVLPKTKAVKERVSAKPRKPQVQVTNVALTEPVTPAEPSIAAQAEMPQIKPSIQQPEIAFRAIELISSTSGTPSKFLLKGEPFEICLSIDRERTRQKFETAMDYTATIFAKSIDTSQRVNLGVGQGVIFKTDEAIRVKIPKQDLVPGAYRLEAALSIGKDSQSTKNPVQARTFLQVY